VIKNSIIGAVIVIAIIAIVAAFYIPKQNPQASINLQDRLSACDSLPNGVMENATETSRIFINIPKDIYPDINLDITSHGANANYISNGGQYGYALGAQSKPGCWSYYFEFDLASSSYGSTGTVDIGSKSGVVGISDYLIHITVVNLSPATSTHGLVGTIHGQLLLGPTCPVERNPPDPLCAAKPYQTTVVAFKATDTATPYKNTASDASGIFVLSLAPGAYVIHAGSGLVYPRCANVQVQVSAGGSQNIVINCDTGIR